MQCEFPLECSQGPVQADIPVLISTLFPSLFSNLWFTSQILRNYNHSQQVCMFCCIAASILCPVLSFAPLFYIFNTCTCVFLVLNSANRQKVVENMLLVIEFLTHHFGRVHGDSLCPYMEKEPKHGKRASKVPIHGKRAHTWKSAYGRFFHLFN